MASNSPKLAEHFHRYFKVEFFDITNAAKIISLNFCDVGSSVLRYPAVFCDIESFLRCQKILLT